MPIFNNLESLDSVRTKINNAITLTEQNTVDIVDLAADVLVGVAAAEAAAAAALVSEGNAATSAGLSEAFSVVATTKASEASVSADEAAASAASAILRASRPEDFGAIADGVTDDRIALATWAASGNALELSPGAIYRVASLAPIIFSANTKVNGHNATILLDYTDTTDSSQIDLLANAVLDNVRILWSGSNYAERGLRLYDGAVFKNGFVGAETEQPTSAVDASEDRTIILNGVGAKFNNNTVRNLWAVLRVNGALPATDCEASNNKIYGYGKGIQPELGGDNFLCKGNEFFTKSSLTTQLPGEGAVQGSCIGLRVLYNTVWEAGEHAFYISESTATTGVVIFGNIVYTSSQSGFKMRNLNGVVFESNIQRDAAFGNSVGTTEDSAAFESCENVRIIDFTARIGVKPNPGQNTIRLDSCQKVLIQGVNSETPNLSVIEINDERFQAAIAGSFAPTEIDIFGVIVPNIGAKPLVNIAVVGACGRVTAKGCFIRGASVAAIVVNIAGGAGTMLFEVDTNFTGTPLTNTAGGGSALTFTRIADYTGTTLNRKTAPTYGGPQPIQVGSLVAAATAGNGARSAVNNSSVAMSGNFGAIVAGGGANIVPVFSDGTNWRIG